MKKLLGNIVILSLLGLAFYVYRAPLHSAWRMVANRIAPCQNPIQYSLGDFDTRFNISKEDFLKAIAEAEAIWEKPTGRELFTFDETPSLGDLKVNLIYDQRQEATAKLQKLGLSVDNDKSSYDALKNQYDLLVRKYTLEKNTFDANRASFETRNTAYQKEVSTWNTRGGAPKAEYDRLEATGAALKREYQSLTAEQEKLNGMVSTINAMVTVLNQMATSLNIKIENYNSIGKTQGEEFEEGLYIRDVKGEHIDIYQFTDRSKLVRVLAHELGHAFGLQHVNDPKAIMYRLNQSTNMTPTDADLAEVTRICGEK